MEGGNRFGPLGIDRIGRLSGRRSRPGRPFSDSTVARAFGRCPIVAPRSARLSPQSPPGRRVARPVGLGVARGK